MPYALRRPRLHFERTGSGEPLLCITGFTISSAVYEPVLPLWGTRYDCITYDNRGSGRSGAPWRTTSMPELASDAARLLDALDVPSAHVFASSWAIMPPIEMPNTWALGTPSASSRRAASAASSGIDVVRSRDPERPEPRLS